ncbi:hypothetical protein [Pseudotabrizicola alkalilacus]|uniref:Uncharacterized protein n=1 Tax=Pseudotabrizicola alkalilacus TaxID=2305252 RepID=A0A411Z1J3_9RHOB|nr:hypothetical protein [Pseudotabrizicola alkalilacus]RGP36934.1 hypothetical protein D1012_12345 [Pseudotabrizicola alkalilacus]
MTLPKLCFCDDCFSTRENWFDEIAECSDGYLFHHEWIAPNSTKSTFSSTAFDVMLPIDGSFQPTILVRFVSWKSLMQNNCEADRLTRIEYADLTCNPPTVLAALSKAGFYISPEGTADHIAGAIRQAVDFTLFEVRNAMRAADHALPSTAPEGVTLQ